MTEEKIILRKLTASDGYVLTNGVAHGREVYLGINDTMENWHQITIEEYVAICAEEEAKAMAGE